MVSLVIPAYNEQKLIKSTVRAAEDFLKSRFSDYEIIVVDDGSTDNTAKELSGTSAKVIALPRNTGKGAAVKCGVLHSNGDYIFFTDADLPYCLDFIEKGVSLLDGCDVVCGSREGDYPLHRRILSAAYNKITQRMLQINVGDIQCGIKGFTKNAAMRIFFLCRIEGFAFDSEALFLADKLGFEVKSEKVSLSHRAQSKVSLLGDGLEMFADVIKIRNSFEAGEYNLRKSYQG